MAVVLLLGLAASARASDVGSVRARRAGSEKAPSPLAASTMTTTLSPTALTPSWHAFPLFGGEMTSMAADPTNGQIAYVGTRDAGVFKTTDGGRSWRPSRSGLTVSPIRTLRLDPTNPATLYAGADFDGVWKSNDGGITWARTGAGLPDSMVVFNIAIDPGHTGTLYAGLAGGVAFSIGAVFKSVDGGATWHQKDAGIPRYSGGLYANAVFSLALNPARPAELAVGTMLDGAFHSTDGGETWTAINGGVPFMSGSTEWRSEIEALAFDPYHANRLTGVIGGQFYSFDSGAWVKRSTGYASLGFLSSRLYYHPTKSEVLFAIAGTGGLYTSTDGGVGWSGGNSTVADVSRVIDVGLTPAEPNTIFAACNNSHSNPGGVMKSQDLGNTWSDTSQGITAMEIRSVAVDPADPRSIYTGTGSGFAFSSHDGGQSWAKLSRELSGQEDDNFEEVSSIAVDPRSSQVLSLASLLAFFRSTDRGATFQSLAAVDEPLAIAAAAGTSASTYFVSAAIGHGVYRSLDGGQTWAQKNDGLPFFGGYLNPVLTVAIDPNTPSTVWAGTQYGGGILRSTDGGDHWSSRGLTDDNFVEAISVKPGNGSEILVGAGYGSGNIYKSVDGGASWQKKLADIGFVKSFVRDPRDPRVIYAGSEGFGVLSSTDGGETWSDFTGSISYPLVYSLALTSDDPPLLIAGSYGSGLYWTRLTQGEPCSSDDTSLCLLNSRFRVTAQYTDYSGTSGTGKAVPLTPDTGYFWFFNSANVESVVKMVSFCGSGSNDVAVYAGGLTDIDVTLHVTDTRTGTTQDYHNPLGRPFALVRDGPFTCPAAVTGIGEASLLAAKPEDAVSRATESPSWIGGGPTPGATCSPDGTTLCLLGNRFQVRAGYQDYSGGAGAGQAVTLTSDTGYFWFFSQSNVEVVAKMVSFCGSGTNNVGIYTTGLTDIGVTLTVTDTKTGFVKAYTNTIGKPFDLIRDGPFVCQ
jgi:photosystem II stability/assembly factor-like uncharacterized protein